tara:strand:- start:434 stop:616 length:183 start_codon:yes stop_codon:yes gene_type:complete
MDIDKLKKQMAIRKAKFDKQADLYQRQKRMNTIKSEEDFRKWMEETAIFKNGEWIKKEEK